MKRLLWLVLLCGCGAIGERITGTKPQAKSCPDTLYFRADSLPATITICRPYRSG